MKKLTLAAAVFAVAAVGLAGCASAGAPTAETSQTAAAEQSAAVTMTGAWAKAAEAGGMSGAFGTLENSGTEDLTVVAASSPAASVVELHEMATADDGAMVMRELEGGFVIPAGGEYLLEPGANHLMLMGLDNGLLAGDTFTITLELQDGSTLDIEATAKDFAGANENYGDENDGDEDHSSEDHTAEDHTHSHASGEAHEPADH